MKVIRKREKEYGQFKSIAWFTQNIKEMARVMPQWDSLSIEEKEAFEMIVHKLSRWVNGGYKEDTLVDICGYAQLVINSKKAQEVPF